MPLGMSVSHFQIPSFVSVPKLGTLHFTILSFHSQIYITDLEKDTHKQEIRKITNEQRDNINKDSIYSKGLNRS